MSAQTLLAPGATSSGTSGTFVVAPPQTDVGFAKGSLLATGNATLVGGALLVTPAGVPALNNCTIFAVPASSANVVATSGAITITPGAASATTGAISTFTIQSSVAGDVGSYKWFVYA